MNSDAERREPPDEAERRNAPLLRDIAYVLGALGQDHTGEGRHETTELLDRLRREPLGEPRLQALVVKALETAVGILRGDGSDRGIDASTILWVVYDAIYRGDADLLRDRWFTKQGGSLAQP